MEGNAISWFWTMAIPLTYLLGVLAAVDAVRTSRTAQGSTAWALAHISIPFVSLPLYWLFGRVRFDDYVRVVRGIDREMETHLRAAKQGSLRGWLVDPEDEVDVRKRVELRGFEGLSTLFFTRGNGARLLVDGHSTFKAMFDAVRTAQDYVLAQSYIIHDDRIGREFKNLLVEAAKRGVRVFLLYDDFGTRGLPRGYLRDLREAGVEATGASGGRRWLGRFRLNFRNHRKILVVDGEKGFLGGLNVGDEYLGEHPRLTPWRDTHLEVEGPVVQGLQFSFLRDWYYARHEVLPVDWEVTASPQDKTALVLASGPADPLETCGLLFAHAIESAERRVWIASPYFVPDGRVLGALQLAALRGADVRILMPRMADHWMFRYVPYAYLPEVDRAGVKVYLYEEGFMHQKVFLVDDDYAGVGTANLDNRSFFLNFEITCLVDDEDFCSEVGDMLEQDFARSTRITVAELEGKSKSFQLAADVVRLLAPVL
jgi:cardiolipin synthase